MKLSLLSSLAAVALCAVSPMFAQDADEFAAGHAEYLSACAACHGENADGNGPIATMFKSPVPNLHGLSAANDGVFPLLKVFQIIDGRSEVRGHGSPMPVFGNRYGKQAETTAGFYGAEPIVRARILELVYYLQSIQS